MSEPQKYSTGSIAPLPIREIPHLNGFLGKNPMTDAKLYARAQWYLARSFTDESKISACTTAGFVSDCLPFTAFSSDDWARSIAIPDGDLVRRRTRVARKGVGRGSFGVYSHGIHVNVPISLS